MEYQRLVIQFTDEESQVNMWKRGSIAARVAGFGEALGLFVARVFESQRMVYFTAAHDVALDLPEIGRKILANYAGNEPPLCLLQRCREFCGKITILEEEVIFPAAIRYSFSWYDESETKRGCSGSMPLQEVVEGVAFYEADNVLYRDHRTTVVAQYKREGDTLVREY